MRNLKNKLFFSGVIIFMISCSESTQKEETEIPTEPIEAAAALKYGLENPAIWNSLADGLEFIEIDSAIWVFKINPATYRFKARYGEKKPLTYWAQARSGAINMGMFHDGKNPSGYTKIEGKVIQPKHNKIYNLYMVWDYNNFKIIDRNKVDLTTILAWPNVSQNIRMITPGGQRNRWQKDEKYWSVSTIATTKDGNVLFIHSRKPYTMHDFINVLLAQDKKLNIDYMLYTEGGPESGIIIRGDGINELPFKRTGSFETGFWENDNNNSFWDVPFALTFERK
jgi:phosphodiester glycosidase